MALLLAAAEEGSLAWTDFMTMLAAWISAVRLSSRWKGRKPSERLPKAHAAGLMR